MTTTVPRFPVAGTTRPSGPSLATLTGIEIGKSLSTRSGPAVAVAAMLLGPAGVLLGRLTGEGAAAAPVVLGFTGMMTALVLLALGVLSTAGEWTHRSVQTSFLLVPRRLRVLGAKVLAVALQGAAFAVVGAALTVAMLWIAFDAVVWTATGGAIAVAVVAGAAFAVIGAGIGAALGNSPAALTGTYLVMLGALPILAAFEPTWAENLDPTTAVVDMARSGVETRPVLVIAGWVLVATFLGAVISRRRSVQ